MTSSVARDDDTGGSRVASGSFSCLVCGETSFEPHLQILLRCPCCGFVTANLDAPLHARSLYEGDYFTGEEYLDYLADEAVFRKNFRRRLADVKRFCSGGRLLEIGSAYGLFLDEARSMFEEVVGFEVNADAARHACGELSLDVRTDDFLSATVEGLGGLFDAVVMWDVIEHLERPDLFIGKIAAVAQPGAHLFLTTGDIGSRVARMRGRSWRLIHPPTHLHYFDRSTLPELLKRCGFETVDIKSVGYTRSWRQILYSIFVLNLKWPGMYDRLASMIGPRAGITLDLGDIMQVAAVRH